MNSMYRFLGAFLALLTVSFTMAPDAAAKATATVKSAPKVQLQKQAAPKKTEAAAQAQEIKTIIREQSAVIVQDGEEFAVPEGALYTTSDECA
jgi:hypothetical protein